MRMRPASHRNFRTSAQGGFTLLLAVLIASVVMSIGLSILSVTLQEYLFSGTGRESEVAFYAADGGMECAQYWDSRADGGKFAFATAPASQDIWCLGNATIAVTRTDHSATKKTFNFQTTWGDEPALCSKVAVTKYHDPSASVPMDSGGTCEPGRTCTEIESRGYNTECPNANAGGFRVVERALRARL